MSGSHDTVRKTWDREEYLQKNKERERSLKRQVEDVVPDSQLSIAGARETGLGLEQQVNKVTLISAKDEGSRGFKCDQCGVSYNDNLSYLDHLNSIQRIIIINQIYELWDYQGVSKEVHWQKFRPVCWLGGTSQKRWVRQH